MEAKFISLGFCKVLLIKAPLLACVLCGQGSAFAAWELFVKDKAGVEHYIDPMTIKQSGGNFLVWRIVNLP